MNKLQHRYCIVGVGNTAYGQTPGQSQAALNVAAIRAALADAGLTTADLDGVRQAINDAREEAIIRQQGREAAEEDV